MCFGLKKMLYDS